VNDRLAIIVWIGFLWVLAILLVLLSHSNNGFLVIYAKTIPTPPPWGYGTYEVTIFFVISGFLIHRNYFENFQWRFFLKRRFLSIFTWYLASIVLVLAFNPLNAKLPGLNSKGIIDLIGVLHAYYTMLGFSNILCDVSVSKHNNINGATWFLGPLFIVYMIYPLLRKIFILKRNILYITILTIALTIN
jgi:peptidoglycan/LPS O-acetylase OafA/YrhL